MTQLNKTQILLLILILLVVGYIIFPRKQPIPDNSLQLAIDSMRVRDNVRDAQIIQLRQQYAEERTHVISLQQQLDRVPEMINNTTKKYNEKRNIVSNLPVDSQVSYMSGWLSEEGSH
jgi:hypothetical protein